MLDTVVINTEDRPRVEHLLRAVQELRETSVSRSVAGGAPPLLVYKGFAGIGIVVTALGTVFPFLKSVTDESENAGRVSDELLVLLCEFRLPLLRGGFLRRLQLVLFRVL